MGNGVGLHLVVCPQLQPALAGSDDSGSESEESKHAS